VPASPVPGSRPRDAPPLLLDEPTAYHAWPPGPASDLDRINRGDARSPGVLAGAQAFGLELIEVRRLPPRDQPQESSP
jgi:hypothetical protein